MKIYRDVTINGSPADVTRLVNAIEKRLTEGWTRNRQAEKQEFRTTGLMYCFECIQQKEWPACQLGIAVRKNGGGWIPNIVPKSRDMEEPGGRELSRDQYNHILESVFRNFMVFAAADSGVAVEMRPMIADSALR